MNNLVDVNKPESGVGEEADVVKHELKLHKQLDFLLEASMGSGKAVELHLVEIRPHVQMLIPCKISRRLLESRCSTQEGLTMRQSPETESS